MILKFFKSNQPIIIILIIVFAIILWLDQLINVDFNEKFIGRIVSMPLYKPISDFVSEYFFISLIVGVVLLILQSLLIVKFNTKYQLVESAVYLPSLIYIFIATSVVQPQYFLASILANFLIIMAFNEIFDSYKIEKISSNIFNAAFFISTGSLIYFNSFYFIFSVWITMLIIRSFKFREWVISFFGLLVPYFLIFCFFYLFSDYTILIDSIINSVISKSTIPHFDLFEIIFFAFLLISFLLSMFHLLSVYGTKKISARKYYLSYVFLSLLCVLAFVLIPSVSVEIIYVIAIPVSFLIADYFSEIKNRWTSESLFAILIGLSLFIHYLN